MIATAFTLFMYVNGHVQSTVPDLTEEFCTSLAEGLRDKIEPAGVVGWELKCVSDDPQHK